MAQRWPSTTPAPLGDICLAAKGGRDAPPGGQTERHSGVETGETKVGRKHWYERERQEPRGGTRELFRVREGRPLGREKTDRPTGKGVVGKKGRRQRAEGESEEVTKMGRKETKEREKEKRNEETTKRGEEKGRKGGKKEWERRRGRGAVRPRGRGKRGERERKRETVSSTRRAAGPVGGTMR